MGRLYIDGGSSFQGAMVPESIGHLIQLEVLVMLGTMVRNLPPSIGHLKCLEILVVENFKIARLDLPPEISELGNLRQLITRVGGDANIGALTNLCVLKTITYGHWVDIKQDNLVNLQELVIEQFCEEYGKSYTLERISKLKRLHTLVLSCSGPLSSSPTLSFLSSCPNLRKLWLEGLLIEVGMNFPKSITVLRLSGSEIVEDDPISTLGKLPNLRCLELDWLKTPNDTIFFGSRCFPELEILSLCNLPNMTGFLLDEGALPKIKRVYMSHLVEDHHIPERLKPVVAQATKEYTFGGVRECFPYKS